MKKKTFLLFITLLLVTIMACIFVACNKDSDDSGDNGDNAGNKTAQLQYESSDNGYVVVGVGSFKGTNLIIPDTYNGSPVIGIKSDAFKDCTKIKSLTVSKNVADIGAGAFSGCTNLSTVNWNAVDCWADEDLDDSSLFAECSALRTINFGSEVKSIRSSIFSNCNNLVSITIPENVTTISASAFENCAKLVEVYNKSSYETAESDDHHARPGLSESSDPFSNVLNVYTEEGGSKLSTDKNGYVIYSDGEDKILVDYVGTEDEITVPTDITQIYTYAFYCNKDVVKVTIPENLASIGKYAFLGCSHITSINWNAKKCDGDGTLFDNENNLVAVNIGENVKSIPDNIFSCCGKIFEVYNESSLTITAGSSDNGYVGYAAKAIYTKAYTSKLSTDKNGFILYKDEDDTILLGYVGNETDIALPNGITEIYEECFYEQSCLTNVTIPNGVTIIGAYAFLECSGLTSIVIPDSVTDIGMGAFAFCTGMFHAELGSGVATIGMVAFYNCEALLHLTWGSAEFSSEMPFYGCDNVVEIYNKTGDEMNFSSMKQYFFPNLRHIYTDEGGSGLSIDKQGCIIYTGESEMVLVKYIGTETTITLPEGTTEIQEGVFCDNKNIVSVAIPDSMKIIGEKSFSGCTGLTSITIPDSVTSIGNYAFSGCTGLTSITIPDSVTSIGDYAFSKCTNLATVNIGANSNIVSIGTGAFSGTEWDSSLSSSEAHYIGKVLYKYKSYQQTSLEIKDGTVSIAPSAVDSQYLTNITIPDSVTSIGDRAFRDCTGLTSVTIGSGVTSIGEYAFFYCTGLTSITIPDSVTSIGEYAFSGCTGLTNITIPDSVTSIGSWAFYNCTGLTSVTIGSGVTSIGSYAFRGCTGLTSITFEDTSTWYNSYWNNKTGGTQTSVTNSSTNATYFTDTYYTYYWYKL